MKISNKALLGVLLVCLLGLGALALATEKAPTGFDPQGQGLQITEICTKNESLLPDSQGRTPDYIELYSAGAAVDLTGYVLTDGEAFSDPLADVMLGTGEYRVFFISPEHTGFSLSASGGDVICLLDPQGNVVAQAQTQPMQADQAMVLYKGGYRVSSEASPGFSNDAAGLAAFRQGVADENPRLVISEVLIDNQSALPDENGRFSDVVELYNGCGEPLNLGSFWLSDDAQRRFEWCLPQMVLESGQYVLIICDGEDYIAEDGTIHAGFSLNRGETLVLTDALGQYQMLSLAQSGENCSLALVDGAYVSMAPSLGCENTEEGALAMTRRRIDFDSPLVISEVLCAEAGVPYQGSVQDVVEICNRSDQPQSTAGWFLSDGGDPYAYALPEMLLLPGQCMALPCSREIVGFSLSEGEQLYLTGEKGRCAPPVAGLVPETGKSLQVTYSAEEVSAVFQAVSLGYDNTNAGSGAWQQDNLPEGLRISEVMSANISFLTDSNGKTYDHLELYNASRESICLSGYALTDDPDRPDKYPLTDATLAPGKYLILILSEKESVSLPYDRVSMGLPSGGSSLYLTWNGQIVDYVIIPRLVGDMAYGRGEGQAEFSCLAQPTPGKTNARVAEVSQKPVALTQQGCYDSVAYVDVELSGSGPIYYTTDAQTPDENARLYTGPIRITATTVIRARCIEPGKQASEVLDLTYVVNEGDQLSVVTLVTDPDNLWGWGNGIYTSYWMDKEVSATVSLFEKEGGGFSMGCGLKMFGGYTRAFPKKSFACMFRDQYGASALHYPLFGEDGLQEYQAFVLRTGGQDSVKGRIRDELVTSLVAQYTNVPVQDYRPVTLYLNGEFWGVYFVREKVNEHFVAGHYNVRAEEVTLQYGNGIDPEYRSLIRYVNTHDLSVQEHYDYVASQIDIEEFIHYHVAQMWTGNVDMGNIKYFKVPGGKWTWILYDTDLALTVDRYDSVAEQLNPAGNGADDIFSTELIVALLENPQFKEQFLRTMAWQAETIWNTPQIMARIDELEAQIRPDMERDIARWNESLAFWNTKLDYLRHVVENRGKYVYSYLKRYFHLTDSQMQELGFQKP